MPNCLTENRGEACITAAYGWLLAANDPTLGQSSSHLSAWPARRIPRSSIVELTRRFNDRRPKRHLHLRYRLVAICYGLQWRKRLLIAASGSQECIVLSLRIVRCALCSVNGRMKCLLCMRGLMPMELHFFHAPNCRSDSYRKCMQALGKS